MSLNRIQIVLFLVVSAGLAAQDASAYYAPEMGQFISRDPIEYRAGDVSLYRYVHNRASNAIDIYGFMGNPSPYQPVYKPPTPVTRPKIGDRRPNDLPQESYDACCKTAAKDALVADTGVITCCEGHVIPCLIEENFPSVSQKVKSILKVCTLEHELQHVKDTDHKCDDSCKDNKPLEAPDKDSLNLTECNAYTVFVACVDSYLADAKQFPAELGLTEKDIADLNEQRNDAAKRANTYCGDYANRNNPLRNR